MLQLTTDEWEEVYKSAYTNSIYNENRTYVGNTGDFYVYNIYFSNLGEDGVIILDSEDVKSLISTSTFENPSRNDNGGSIYIKNGQSSIRKVCSFGSKSQLGAFCYIEVQYFHEVNEAHDSSITYSNRGDLSGSTTTTMILHYGNISFIQNNITRNYCESCLLYTSPSPRD